MDIAIYKISHNERERNQQKADADRETNISIKRYLKEMDLEQYKA